MKLPRLALVLGGAVALAAAAFYLHERGPGGLWFSPGCLLRRFTGIVCPGCGMTRASYALLHGEFSAALKLNPLGIVLLPIALLGCALELLAWVLDRPLPMRFRPRRGTAAVLAITLILYTVIRSLPFWPFPL